MPHVADKRIAFDDRRTFSPGSPATRGVRAFQECRLSRGGWLQARRGNVRERREVLVGLHAGQVEDGVGLFGPHELEDACVRPDEILAIQLDNAVRMVGVSTALMPITCTVPLGNTSMAARSTKAA